MTEESGFGSGDRCPQFDQRSQELRFVDPPEDVVRPLIRVAQTDDQFAFRGSRRCQPFGAESARIALLPHASYSAARKPRGGLGIASSGARWALPLKRRSG